MTSNKLDLIQMASVQCNACICFESLTQPDFNIKYYVSGTATRLSIRRGRRNSRAHKYSLAVHEPEIQAINSPGIISGQDLIAEEGDEEGLQDTVGELEQVTQLGKTVSIPLKITK